MYNYKVDLVKVWASIAVVLIHVTAFLPTYNKDTLGNYMWYRPLLNIAVPFFFGVSGYLLSRKPVSYFKKYFRNIASMFLIYSVFYAVFEAVLLFIKHQTVSTAFTEWWQQRGWLSLINGTWGQYHLWFLFALMISAGVYGFLYTRGVSSCNIFLIALVIDVLYWLFLRDTIMSEVFKYGGVIKGFVFVSMGYYLEEHDPPFSVTKYPIIIAGILYVVIFNYCSNPLISELTLIGVTFLLLTNVIHTPGQETWLSQWSDYSMEIYILHVVFIKIVQLYGEVSFWNMVKNDVLYTIILSAICVVGSIICYPFVEKWIYQPFRGFLRDKITLEKSREMRYTNK